jgi:hypothetical protein
MYTNLRHRWLVVLLAGACRTALPDLDAVPTGAAPLRLARPSLDSLECPRSDCADWFRIEVDEPGDLVVAIEPVGTRYTLDARHMRVALFEAAGGAIGRPASQTRPVSGRAHDIRLRSSVRRGSYLLALFAGERRERVDYRVTAELELPPPEPLPQLRPRRPPPSPPPKAKAPPPAPPPPPAPRFETRRGAVLEVENSRSGPPNVLLELGRSEGIRPGHRGRLVDGGESIAEIVVIAVYPDGSRARIERELSGTVTARTVAEIQVPVDPASGGITRTPSDDRELEELEDERRRDEREPARDPDEEELEIDRAPRDD